MNGLVDKRFLDYDEVEDIIHTLQSEGRAPTRGINRLGVFTRGRNESGQIVDDGPGYTAWASHGAFTKGQWYPLAFCLQYGDSSERLASTKQGDPLITVRALGDSLRATGIGTQMGSRPIKSIRDKLEQYPLPATETVIDDQEGLCPIHFTVRKYWHEATSREVDNLLLRSQLLLPYYEALKESWEQEEGLESCEPVPGNSNVVNTPKNNSLRRQSIPKAYKWMMLTTADFTCYYCKRRRKDHKKGPDNRPWHIDHRVPLALGGVHGPENFVLSCAACNLRKAARDPQDFLQPCP
jgi:5-methylcytosine-specific restriction endonuclease McrA